MINWLLTYIDNFRLKICDYKWNYSPHEAQCQICRQVIKSKKIKYSPESCGWCRIKDYYGKNFVCHKCLSHRNYKPYVNQVDEDERKIWGLHERLGR